MDKAFASPEAAIADLADGSRIAVSGFGMSAGAPFSLLAALRERGSRDLCLVANTLGSGGTALIENHQVSRLIVSFTTRGGSRSLAEERIESGEIREWEVVPQGTLVERLRAGGAGLGGIYTPTGLGTSIAQAQEIRVIDGAEYLFQSAIRVDYAFISAARADRAGNLEFNGANIHFAPSFAKAARIAVAEVDEIVETGQIPPERIGLPGIFVDRVVVRTVADTIPRHAVNRRAADVAREYSGKPGWSRQEMGERAAALLPEHSYVNLGLGIPTQVSTFIKGRDIILHGENGILGYGELVSGDDANKDVFNAGGQSVSANPGISYFDSVEAFEMARSGRLNVVVLGAYQVDEHGSVANWSVPGNIGGGIGGAMDLIAGAQTVMILLEHRDSNDRAKLVRQCTYPLTGKQCVDYVITDLAVLQRRDKQFWLVEVAPGFSVEEVLSVTEMHVRIDPRLEKTKQASTMAAG
jgi:3-oxoacid CoA-transferase